MTPGRPSRFRRALLLAFGLALCGLCTGRAAAQVVGSNLPTPRLNTITPLGAKMGSTVELTFTGTDLDEPEKLLFSHSGIKAEPVVPDAPKPDPNKKPLPPPAPRPAVTKFKVTVGANVPVGFHDVRLVNKWGVSNPRTFVVGDLTEVLEKEPNNDKDQAQRVEVNSTVNGAMASPTDVDYFVFAAKKGQRIVLSCLASSIDSRFNPGLELYDASGKLLHSNRNYRDTDALLDLSVPDDGDFIVRLYQFTHTAGNAEYFYRLSITTAPWIDAVFPPLVEPGKPTQVTLYGRNLPGGKPDPDVKIDGVVLEKATVTLTPPADAEALTRLSSSGLVAPLMAGLDGFEYRTRNSAGSSNSVLLCLTRTAVVREAQANDTAETAQEVTLPCEIAGLVEKKRDRDWYGFSAKRGEVYTIEVQADRLGASGDTYFSLRNAANKQTIIELDDPPQEQVSNKFYNRSDDPPPYRFTVPADGKYQLLVASRNANEVYGPRECYRVRIAAEAPDFRLFVLPSGMRRPKGACVGQGGNESFNVYAWRRDGFNGEITLSVDGLPKGVTCPPQVMPASLKHAVLVVSAATDAAAWTGEIKVKGTTTINGKAMVREARPASITWQNLNFQATVSRLDRGLWLAVRGKAPYSLTPTMDKAEVLHGDRATIKLKLERHWPDFKGALQVQINPQSQGQPPFLPQGLVLPQTNIAANQKEATLSFSVSTTIPPGTYNLVFFSQTNMPFNKDPMSRQKPNTLVVQYSAPLRLTVLPRSVATVSVSAGTINGKVGGQAEVVVRVARRFEYTGPFKVELVVPSGVKGLSADEVTIPAGQNEAKLLVKIDDDATLGNRNNLTVRATAAFGKTMVTQETKLNVNVVK